MRQELLDPLKDNSLFETARKLVYRIYRSLDSGKDYTATLDELNQVAQKKLCAMDIEDAAELIDPRTYAYEVIADLIPVPTDLSYAEMLEIVEQIVAQAARDGPQLGHWIHCLEANTGDRRISTLLQSPELYFRDTVPQELTAKDMLDIALAAGGKTGA
jgi:hypothetical protein